MAATSHVRTPPLTFAHCLAEALASRETSVLGAPGRRPSSGATVLSALHVQTRALRALGVRAEDRIAYALPDSAATASLAITLLSCAVAAPVNPKLAPAELEKTFRNLNVRGVIVPADADSSGRRAARTLGLPTIDFHPVADGYAGQCELLGPSLRDAASAPERTENDPALVVQTSGTTGVPKVVCLTHRNLLSMMLANCTRLGLTSDDRCVGLMPLFHIHGLGAVLCSMLSGGFIHVLSEFGVERFYDALREERPTWYTAVPSIHQTILRAAPAHAELVASVAAARQLRFIRSGSAPMPAGVPEQLEQLFNTRYVEACGATECSAYICSNGPADRKIGSVGRPMPGNDVRIRAADGALVGPNVEGEIIARGPGVFGGYEAQPHLNAESFHEDYFRTGDLGYVDEEGYFYLTGRLKEQINRAGMKISPREVDDVLAGHPAVGAVATFAVKDAALGEEVHAAVVVKIGESVSALDLQRFAASRLADYKVPREFHFVKSIPTNATGKIVRVNLAKLLGVRAAEADVIPCEAPTTPTECAVAAIFSRILKREVDDIHLSFQDAGADSIAAMDLSLELERQFGRTVPVSALSGRSTVAALARMLESDGWKVEPGAPVVFQSSTDDTPTLFCLPGVGGNVWCYSGVSAALGRAQPVVGLPLPGTDGLETPLDEIGALADRFTSMIRSLQPHGPYLLTGYSFGGRIAYEVCQRLQAAGESIGRLILIDTAGPNWPPPLKLPRRVALHAKRLIAQGPAGYLRRLRSRRSGTFGMLPAEILAGLELQHATQARQAAQLALIEASARASRGWKPLPARFPITVLHASKCMWLEADVSDESMGWRPLAGGELSVEFIRGSHGTLFHDPQVQGLSMAIAGAIRAAR